MHRQIDCPECHSRHTSPIPETMWMRGCDTCFASWDIRSPEEIELDSLGWPY